VSTQPRRPERKNPSLLPREHGVYAEVAFPILTALWIGRPSVAGICFAIAVIAAFMVHEPALVLMGRRGAWVKSGLGQQAKRWIVILAGIAAVCSAVGLWRSTDAARLAFLVLVPVAVPLAFMTVNKQEKTIAGECLIALIVSLASVPIAMAGGASARIALAAALVWTVVFVSATATVHAILARAKRRTGTPAVLVAVISLMVAAGAARACVLGGPSWLVALVPAPLVGFGVLVARLPVQRLRTLGWLLVLGNLATATLLVLTLG